MPPLASVGRLALSQDELVDWGRRLGSQITPPLLVALFGELGAGKTTLARAICDGYGVRASVTSPTFAIVHTYDAPRSPVHHLDLYRLDGPRDLQNIAWDDLIEAEALVLVEWPERAGELLPQDHVSIELSHVDGEPDKRVLYAGGHPGHRMGER